MDKRKKVYIIVIAAGAVALAIDRLYLSGGPAPADAAPSVVPAGSKPAAVKPMTPVVVGSNAYTSDSAPPTGNQLIPDIPFPRGVPAWHPEKPMRDLFRPPFQEASATGDGPGSNAARKRAESPGRDGFADRHKLQLVLSKDSFSVAVVDGAWLRVGDAVEGCALREIRGSEAIFACHNGDAELSMTGDKSVTKP